MDPITREVDALSPAAAVLYGVVRYITQPIPNYPQNQQTSAIASLPQELITLIAEKLAKLDAPSLTNFAAASAFCLAASHGQLRAVMLAGVQTCLTNFADYVSAPKTSKRPASTRRAPSRPCRRPHPQRGCSVAMLRLTKPYA